MDVYANSLPSDDQVTTMGSQQAGGESPKKGGVMNEDIDREDELLEKLEKMFLKIKSKSVTNRDAWEGEDEDTEEVLEIRQHAQKQKKKSKAQLLANNKEQAALDDRETVEDSRRKTFPFKHGPGPRKNDNKCKQKTEEELNQLRKFALQRHCKKKRRTRKAMGDCHEKAETKVDQMLAVHAELEKTVVQVESTLRTEGSKQLTTKKEEMSTMHAEMKTKHLSGNMDLDKIKDYVSEIINTAREKVLKEATALKVLKVQESVESNDDRRNSIMAVHEELLSVFNSGARITVTNYDEKVKSKSELMLAVHAELKRLVFLKGLCLDEDDDDLFVPRKLFMFKVDNLQKVSQIVVSPQVATNCDDVNVPSSSEELVMGHVEESKAPPKENRRVSLRQRLMRFIGFR